MNKTLLLFVMTVFPVSSFATSLAEEYESRGTSSNQAIQQHINWGIEACMAVIQKRAIKLRASITDSEVAGGRASYGAFTNTVYAKLSNGIICSCDAEPGANSASCQ